VLTFIQKSLIKHLSFTRAYKGIGLKVKNEGDSNSEWYGAGFALTDCEDGPEMYI